MWLTWGEGIKDKGALGFLPLLFTLWWVNKADLIPQLDWYANLPRLIGFPSCLQRVYIFFYQTMSRAALRTLEILNWISMNLYKLIMMWAWEAWCRCLKLRMESPDLNLWQMKISGDFFFLQNSISTSLIWSPWEPLIFSPTCWPWTSVWVCVQHYHFTVSHSWSFLIQWSLW